MFLITENVMKRPVYFYERSQTQSKPTRCYHPRTWLTSKFALSDSFSCSSWTFVSHPQICWFHSGWSRRLYIDHFCPKLFYFAKRKCTCQCSVHSPSYPERVISHQEVLILVDSTCFCVCFKIRVSLPMERGNLNFSCTFIEYYSVVVCCQQI
jgi:hypothetical protein